VAKYSREYNQQIVLFPFAADVALSGTGWQRASTAVVSVPRTLISYYDQRIAAVLVGELQNCEAGLCMLDTAGNAIGGGVGIPGTQRVAIIGGLTSEIKRYGSDIVDLSPFFRSEQIQCLGVQAHPTVSGGFARNLTAVLYLGTVTIGRQPT